MPQEFEGDLAGSVFWGADLSGSMFRDVDLSGVRVSHARLVEVEIDAEIDRLVINGVDVTDFVNAGDPWNPLRSMLRPTDPADMPASWAAVEDAWATTMALAEHLDERAVQASVNGEFSLVQTLRHLVFATDKWFTHPILGEPFHPMGLPNTGSLEFPFPGIDLKSAPTFAEALAARNDRVQRFGDFLGAVTADELAREVEVLENGPHTVQQCIETVLEEEFWHNRYACRDLTEIAASA